MNSEPDVVIVGAGAAGIGAARELAKSGRSVVVLEALPRLGGRAWTQQTRVGPVDLGCGWLHSADRNPWVSIARQSGFEVVEGPTAWGTQYKGLGFSAEEEKEARRAYTDLNKALRDNPPDSDIASDALPRHGRWNAYLNALSGFGNGAEFDRISARDYSAYDVASTAFNWRVRAGYGEMIARQMPEGVQVSLGTPLQSIDLSRQRIELQTPRGTLWSNAVIMTVSTNVLATDAISLPSELRSWQDAANQLPLGNNEKLFLEIVGESVFEPETHVIGDPQDVSTGSYYIRPFGMSVIECFLGGAGARFAANEGANAAFAFAMNQLCSLFGSSARNCLRPLAGSEWANNQYIGGAYSHALPNYSSARQTLATSFDQRVFFAGEATHTSDFSTAHGALETGVRAAKEFLVAR